MPAPYGVTSTGFSRKNVTEILADIEARQRAEISAALDLASNTPWGQLNGILANEIGIAWEQLEICYSAFDPDAAEDFLLQSLGKLTGTERRAASYSLVELSCNLDITTTLISGTHYAAVSGNPESLWTPVEDYTAAAGGAQNVVFRAENTGAIEATAGTITVIHTAVVGWNSVTNANPASAGREIDTDAILRQRREEQLAATGSATVDAIRSDVLEVADVESCTVFENDTHAVDAEGRPPHSVEVLVYDGDPAAADNNAIAQAIWDTKAAGIQTVGSDSGTAVDSEENNQTVYFSRPTPIRIYLEIDVTAGSDYVTQGGDAALATYLAAQCTSLHNSGDDVRWRRIDSLAFAFGDSSVPTIVDVTAFKLDTVTPAVGTTNITIAADEIATFAAGDITVNS